jgi:hypothetical protein
VCAAHEQQDFSVFCHYLAIQLHKKLLEVPEVIHELEFSVYLVVRFLRFLSSGMCCTCQSPMEVTFCAISIAA